MGYKVYQLLGQEGLELLGTGEHEGIVCHIRPHYILDAGSVEALHQALDRRFAEAVAHRRLYEGACKAIASFARKLRKL